jgi:multiple sugar transport system substrate-binding protein
VITRRAVLASIAVLAAVAVGCGGDDDEGDAAGGGSGETLTVWNNEFQPDRMAATQDILDQFTEKTGIKSKQVAVPEDQLATLMTNAAAAGELPDVVLATPVQQSQQYAAEEIFDSEAAQAVIDNLGADTFSEKAIELVSRDGVAIETPATTLMAGSAILTVPIIVLFLFAERLMTEGLTRGAEKG